MARRENPMVDEVLSHLPSDGTKVTASELVAALLAGNPHSMAARNLPQMAKAGYIVGEITQLENGNYTAVFSRPAAPVAPVAPVAPAAPAAPVKTEKVQ